MGILTNLEPHSKWGQFEKRLYWRFFLNYEDVVLFDILKHGQTVKSQYYYKLLERVYKVSGKRFSAIVNRNESFHSKIMLPNIHKKWPWIKLRSWMASSCYIIHLTIQTWRLLIITYLGLWRISFELGNLRMLSVRCCKPSTRTCIF